MLKITKDIEIDDIYDREGAEDLHNEEDLYNIPDAYMTNDEGNIICQYHKYHISINTQ